MNLPEMLREQDPLCERRSVTPEEWQTNGKWTQYGIGAELAALVEAADALCGLAKPTADAINAYGEALAAAEAKLADAEKHALVMLHALAGCVEWMGADGCDCGSDDPRCALCEAQAVIEKHAARRAHDTECESEFDSQVHAQTPCGCAARRKEEAR